jgi:sarcosine oxidase subunit gamma
MSAAWLEPATARQRFGLKGPGAAQALKLLGLTVPPEPNRWAPLRTSDRDDSWNVIGRLGNTEFFIEEGADAPGIAALSAGEFAGAYPVLREDFAIVLGGARAGEVLAQVCNVNLADLPHPRTVVMTLMIGVGVLVLPQQMEAGPVYRIWCDPSYGSYLGSSLEQIVQKISTGRA